MNDLYSGMGSLGQATAPELGTTNTTSLRETITQTDFSSQTSTTDVESIDLSAETENPSSDTTSFTSTTEIDDYISFYQDKKKEIEQEQKLLEEEKKVTIDGQDFLALYQAAEGTILLNESRIDTILKQYNNGILNNRLEEWGSSLDEFTKLSHEEKVNFLAQHDTDIKKYMDEITKVEEPLDNWAQQATEYSSYKEYQNALDSINGDLTLLTTALQSLEQQKAFLPYNNIMQTEDYQNYSTNTDSLNNIYKYYDYTSNLGKFGVSYSKYCSEEEEMSPLEFLQRIKENYNFEPINMIGVDDDTYERLKQLTNLSESNPDLAKMYNYLYDTKGEEEANKYLEIIEPQLNQMEGQKKQQSF